MMTAIQLLHNFQLRLALSWVSIRTMSWFIQYNIGAIPLLVLTVISAIVVGLLLQAPKPSGTPIEENVFIAMDTKSSRIEEDILRNNKHIEIVISKKGVNTNQ